MSETVETILLYTIGAGLLSIVYGFFTGKNILNQSAGRISNSKFKIGNKKFILNSNEGKNTLHGGKVGFSILPWKKLNQTKDKVIYQGLEILQKALVKFGLKVKNKKWLNFY